MIWTMNRSVGSTAIDTRSLSCCCHVIARWREGGGCLALPHHVGGRQPLRRSVGGMRRHCRARSVPQPEVPSTTSALRGRVGRESRRGKECALGRPRKDLMPANFGATRRSNLHKPIRLDPEPNCERPRHLSVFGAVCRFRSETEEVIPEQAVQNSTGTGTSNTSRHLRPGRPISTRSF